MARTTTRATRARCTVCGRPATQKCKYCGDSLCEEHLPPEKHWCVGSGFDEVRRKENKKESRKNFGTNFGVFSHNYSYLLLLLISASFALQLLVPGYERQLVLMPAHISERPWTLVTHVFLHGGLWHLFFNMFFLVFFGPVLERKIGSSKFLLVFFGSGIFAGLVYGLTAINPSLGASGALYGVFGALAVLMPRMRIYIFPLPVPLEMWMVVILFAVLNFLMIGSAYPIAFTAHLAGLFFGLLAGVGLKRR
ncbi:MAG: rhomboid family intramembrane serine protease [Candidatus Methanospirareceae archaeon]